MWSNAPEVLRFVQSSLALVDAPRGWRCLELGSHAMHDHNPRRLTSKAGCGEHIGIDLRDGPGVDLVGAISEAPKLTTGLFGYVLSLSSLEHDNQWQNHVKVMAQLIAPGGVIALSMPGYGWKAHEVDCSPDGSHYRNIAITEALSILSARLDWRGLDIEQVNASYVSRSCVPRWRRACIAIKVGQKLTANGRHGVYQIGGSLDG